MHAEIVTKRFVMCPGCKVYQHGVEHMLGGARAYGHNFGPWLCGTEDCMTEVSGTITADGEIELRTKVREEQRGFALLKLRDLYLVVKEPYGRVTNPDYFYHSHQCPTNILSRVEIVVYGPSGESDIHGLIRYVAGIDDTPDSRVKLRDRFGQQPSLRHIMELFGTDGEPIETEWPEANEGALPLIAQWRREEREKS